MHKLLKLIALLGVVAISSTLVVSTATAEWYTPYVDNLASVGVDFGDVGANTTRCEWAEGVVQWNGLLADLPAEPTFLDVPATHPCYEFVEVAYSHGVLGGYTDADGDPTGYFGPSDLVTREQAGKMIVEGEGLPLVEDSGIFPDEASLSGWFTDAYYHSTVYAWAKMVGDSDTGMFRGGDNINHAEAAKVITITAELNDDYLETPDDIIEAVGDLDVVISGDTPVGATLPSGATSVPMATWIFTAGDDDAVIGSVKIHRFGVSNLPTGHSVYLYKGTERLTSGKNINSTTNLAIFNNLNYELSAGESVELTLRMDVGTVATSGEIGFEVAEVDAGSGEVLLGEVKGDMFGLSTTSAGTVTIEKNGTVVDAKVGEKGFTLAKFKISAATENASIEEFGLYVGAGSVNTADLENFKLYVSGQTDPLAEITSVNTRDIVQFLLDDPYLLDKGDTRSFRVTAELNTGRTGDTIEAYIDETTDVVAIGATYGYGMIVAATTYDGTTCTVAAPTECNAMTLEGGDITIAGTTIVNRNIAVNQEDVSILNFTITAATDVTFDNFAIHLVATETAGDATAGMLSDATGTPANFTDIKIVEVGGSHVWGPIDGDALVQTSPAGTTVVTEGTDTNSLFYLFTDDLVMDAGETREFELTLDVANEAALGNETITATIDIDATYPVMKDVNNKTLTNSTSLVPTSDYAGDAFTVKSNSLTVVRSAAVGSSTQVVGTDDVSLLALSVGAGDANAVTITQVKVTGYIDDGGATNLFVVGSDTVYFNEVVLGMDLYEGSIAPENKINVSAKAADTGGEATFDNLTWEIPAGQTVTLYVVGELAANSSYNADQLKVDILDVSADIVAEDGDGNSISSTSSDGPNGLTVDSTTLYTQLTISSGGTLAVDIPSNTPASEIVVAGTSGNEFSKVKFTATQESFIINKMALRNSYSDTTDSATVGDYDDNIDTLTVKYYTDEEQTVEGSTICAAAAESSYYVCTGMDMMVPDPDLSGVPDYATLTIEADLNDVADSLADEGDKPYFAPSLAYDFEATGSSSGKKIEENGTNGLTVTDSVVGSYTLVSNGMQEALAITDTLLTVSDNDNMVEGSLLCLDDNDGATCGADEEIVYVIARCTAADVPHDDCANDNEVVIKRGVNGTNAYIILGVSGDDMLYYTAATVLGVNYMQVQATDISMTASSSTRTGSTSSTEAILTFTATADPAKDPLLRQGYYEGCTTDSTAFVNSGTGPTSSNATGVAGNGLKLLADATITNGGGEVYQFSTGDAADYARVSFWIYWQNAAATALPVDDIKFVTSDDAIFTGANVSNLGSTALVNEDWTFFDMAVPTGTLAGDDYFGLYFNDGDTVYGIADTDYVILDEVIFYNEKINVDLKLNENWAAITPTVAYLKQNGTTVATAYADLDGVVSSKTGQIQFVPVSTYADIEINGTDTFVVEMDTATAITDDATATEKLTATIDLGNVDTASDVYWYDGSDILNFLGINATDKIDTVTSY